MAKPTKQLKDVPKLRDIQRELEYPKGKRKKDFMSKVNSYASRFTSTQGIPGVSLHKWAAPRDHAGLLEITAAFLDKDGYGMYFWPDDKTSKYHGKLQYSKSSDFIKQKMAELFFRNNQEQRRYEARARAVLWDKLAAKAAREVEGCWPTTLAPTEESTSPGVTGDPGPSHRPRVVSISDSSDSSGFPDWTERDLDADEPIQNDDSTSRDIYDVPTSPALGPSERSKGKRPAQSNQDEESPDNKRFKTKEHVADPADTESMRRTTSRERTRTQHPGFVDFEDGDWSFVSSASSSKPNESVTSDSQWLQRSMGPPPAPMSRRRREDTAATLGRYSEGTRPQTPPGQDEDMDSVPLPESPARETTTTTGEPIQESKFVPQPSSFLREEYGFGPEASHLPDSPIQLSPASHSPLESAQPPEVVRGVNSPQLPPPNLPAPIAPMDVLSVEQPNATGLDSVQMPITPSSPTHPQEGQPLQIMIKYHVQISRRCRKRWDLDEAFQRKSLKDLANELPIESKFKGLHLRLDLYLPKREFIEDQVLLGDEDGFEIIKRQFRNDMEDFQARHQNKDDIFTRCFVITLTPLWEDDGGTE